MSDLSRYENDIERLEQRTRLVLSSLEGAPDIDQPGLTMAQEKIYDGLHRLMALIGK